MNPRTPTQILFLEDLLRNAAAAAAGGGGGGGATIRPSPPPPPPSAQAILQAWSELRDPNLSSNPHRLLTALHTLSSASHSSLHVADPQAKLLLSLLSSSSLPPSSHTSLLRLLYAWLRKSPRPSPSLLLSAASLLPPLLSPSPHSILLLGALIAAPALPPPSRTACLDLLCRLIIDDARPALTSKESLLPDLLAGLGYALSKSDPAHFAKIAAFILGMWNSMHGTRPSLTHGLMVLRLVEWCVSGFLALRSFFEIESLCREISPEKYETMNYARFAVVMAAAGVLRASRMAASSGRTIDPRLRNMVEESISSVAKYALSGKLGEDFEYNLILQCISLGLARCGLIAFSSPVLLCLCSALLSEIFPLPSFFRRSCGNPDENSAILGLNEVKEHVDGILFNEAGAVMGVFCNQYGLADEERRVTVERCIWEYTQEIYRNHRVAALVHRGRNDELLGELEKIAEAAFLMVVIFAAEVSKHKLNPKSYREVREDAAVRILISFSCVEYLRRVRLPEYTDAVRRAVLTIQGNAILCASFVESMPPYIELTNPQGLFTLEGRTYVWSEDEVQTARILFYLRVIPTCIGLIPSSVFAKLVAPTMFLYIQHPNEKVARASHSVFVAFISSGRDSEQDERSALKEKLVFYYIERSLEAYPGVTPFEGLASGVAALVRYLPAGSPAIFYCVQSLIEKEVHLCKEAMGRDPFLWKNWEGSSEPCKKGLDLLLLLISLVDIQVFPYMLKHLAEFVIQLPKDGQNIVLDEMYFQAAESDDVTRKPVLVSWLQSLSYLVKTGSVETISSKSKSDVLSLNGTCSRL